MDLLPTPEAGPEAAYARNVLLEELEDALHELPEEQREVFIAHELKGRSFKELAHAEHLWAESDQFLASGWFDGAQLDPLRWVPWGSYLKCISEAQYEGALG